MSKIKTRKTKTRRARVSPMTVYLDMIANHIAQGTLDEMSILADDELQVGFDTVYSKISAKKFYIITVLPALINESFFQDVRIACNDNKGGAKVDINFTMSAKPHFIDWNSREMKSRRNAWVQYDKEKASEHGDKGFKEASAQELESFDEWRKASWMYIQDVNSRMSCLLNTELIVEIKIADRTREARLDLKKVCGRFEQYCAKNNIRSKKVNNTLIDFLRYTSPAAIEEKSLTAKTISNRIIADETLAGMCTYTAGKVNDEGIFMGIDINTGMPTYKSLVRPNGDAENFIIMAATGGGKSYTIKALMIQVRANRFHQIVLDVDGEYKPIAEQMDGVIIDMSKGTGLYFDSVQISDLTGDQRIDSTLYTEAQTATTTVFNALCDADTGMTTTEEKLYSDAYNKMLTGSGVILEDKNTWANSKGLTYYTLYESIKSLTTDPAFDVYTAELRVLIDKLYVFFEPAGLRSYMFSKSISINEILSRRENKPMMIDIVLNLDATTNASKRNSIETTLKQITATYLITLLTNYFKSLGEFTVHYIEEYQRYATNVNVADLILYMITGNRKRNAATFIITNSPRALVESASSQSQAVVDNINNFIIGTLKPNTVDMVCNAFNLQNCSEILHSISENEMYKHVFLMKINDKDTTLIKQSIPPHISDTPLFLTRNTIKYDELEED